MAQLPETYAFSLCAQHKTAATELASRLEVTPALGDIVKFSFWLLETTASASGKYSELVSFLSSLTDYKHIDFQKIVIVDLEDEKQN